MFRISTVHAASRMASKMIDTYQPYMEFSPGPLSVSYLPPAFCITSC